MAGVSVDVKEALDKFMSTFESFKEENDSRLAQIEKKGSADILTEEKLDRINESLDRMEDMNQLITAAAEAAKAQGEQLDNIETALKRVGKGPIEEAEELAFVKKQAFFKFCRKGKEGLSPEEIKVLTISDDTTGGYLAPSEYVREIIKDTIEFSPVRSIARVRSTSQRSIMHPKRTGTFAAVWVAETGTKSETTGLTYGLEEIPNHELYALVDISEQDLEDSEFDLEAELNSEFAEQFGVAEGTAFVLGTAVGQPEGFMVNSDVSETNAGHATLLQADGLIDLFYAIKTAYSANAVWVMRRATIGEVRKLKDGNGQYLWMPGIASGVPNSILGAPYRELPDMAAIAADSNPIAFGDFRRAYIIVDRVRLSMLRDPFTQATTGSIRFIARRRIGGQVVLAEAIRKLKIAA